MPAHVSIQKILVPLDGSERSERALPWAQAIGDDHTDVILMEVIPAPYERYSLDDRLLDALRLGNRELHEPASRRLEEVRARWFPDRENIMLVIAEGDPTEQVLWTARQHDADLILMASAGRSAIGRFFSGSVADRVMRHAPLPVMVVGPDSPSEEGAVVERILAPVDGSGLSLGALPVAATLSAKTGAPVEVVTVLEPAFDEFPALYQAYQPLPSTAEAEVGEQREATAREMVQAAANRIDGMGGKASGDVFRGNVDRTLLDMVRPSDVLVIASHARKGLPRWVLGSTAMKLLQHAPAPVIVVTREYLELMEAEEAGG
jgi:nucleotide-binding universal stress UspA family protein